MDLKHEKKSLTIDVDKENVAIVSMHAVDK